MKLISCDVQFKSVSNACRQRTWNGRCWLQAWLAV